MADTELTDGRGFSMRIGGADRVCITVPVGARDPVACAGLDLEKIPAGLDTDVLALVFTAGASEPCVVTVKKLAAEEPPPAPQPDQAEMYAHRHVQSFDRSLPPPNKVDMASLRSSVASGADGASSYDMRFDVTGARPGDPYSRMPHQHQFVVPTGDGYYAVIWASSARSAQAMDLAAEKAAGTIRVPHPPSGAAYRMGYVVGTVAPIAIGLVVAGVLIYRHERRKKRELRRRRKRRKAVAP